MDLQQHGLEKADQMLRYLEGTLQGEELEQFEAWLAADEANRQLFERLRDAGALQHQLDFMNALNTEAAWEKVARQTTAQQKVVSLRARILPYAAAVLLLAGGAAVIQYLNQKDEPPTPPVAISVPAPATPSAAGNQTRLVLADGSLIVLDEAADGTVRAKGGIRVTKRDGEVVYEVQPGTANGAEAYNTLSTPAGGQIRIVLPDGSRAWLNAASSLRFPTDFRGDERKVELSGEGYFEVARKEAMPFRIAARGTLIEVLGTHFNVMAYDNEVALRTTLLEGSVKVQHGSASRLLKPGYAASVQGEAIAVAPADLEEAVSWKEGRFQFQETSLQMIMRQIERWYDVEVQYAAGVKDERFSGTIPRSATVAQVLEMLELTRTVKFTTEGKKITVRRY